MGQKPQDETFKEQTTMATKWTQAAHDWNKDMGFVILRKSIDNCPRQPSNLSIKKRANLWEAKDISRTVKGIANVVDGNITKISNHSSLKLEQGPINRNITHKNKKNLGEQFWWVENLYHEAQVHVRSGAC